MLVSRRSGMKEPVAGLQAQVGVRLAAVRTTTAVGPRGVGSMWHDGFEGRDERKSWLMGHFISFPPGTEPDNIPILVMSLVDPVTDAGAVPSLVSSNLRSLDGDVAALFDTDPLLDYRAQRPMLNYRDGQLTGLVRQHMTVHVAKDVEGRPFLHMHGAEPDFRWDSLTADMLDLAERFSVQSIYSFTAVGAATPHTRPADMIVRTSDPGVDRPVLKADFWFPSSFADYFEYHAGELGITTTNVAVRVPFYLTGNRYSAGAAGALSMVSSLSGLRFPMGDLEREASAENAALAELGKENAELSALIGNLEKEHDEHGVTPGFVTAPEAELSVPSVDEIGRAAEQFLAQADAAEQANRPEMQFDPQGLIRRIAEYRESRSQKGKGHFTTPVTEYTSAMASEDAARYTALAGTSGPQDDDVAGGEEVGDVVVESESDATGADTGSAAESEASKSPAPQETSTDDAQPEPMDQQDAPRSQEQATPQSQQRRRRWGRHSWHRDE